MKTTMTVGRALICAADASGRYAAHRFHGVAPLGIDVEQISVPGARTLGVVAQDTAIRDRVTQDKATQDTGPAARGRPL